MSCFGRLIWRTNDFVYEDQPTDLSQRLKETFQEWIETLPNQELKQVCDLFFDTILDSGIESLDDISIKTLPKLGQMLQEFGNLYGPTKEGPTRWFQPVALDFLEVREQKNIACPS